MDQFDVGYFVLIITDESHCSICNVYDNLFKYYDALQIGLIATSLDMLSRTPFGLFGCGGRIPIANYPLYPSNLQLDYTRFCEPWSKWMVRLLLQALRILPLCTS
ncbi:hypothetical protein [Endozoicomonas euniceicola]|uniref:Helicase ATP-binding domain-containing protein n=1 Tax=Endozoicomonas euniceicola TaxID=1234143 RepID=A0ABY6GQC5_9GAMM|nr:hypothetical protein [Endozoicomonas euniceicola]UYM14762.1 hypothetical protein NX720_17965 [Endozoicomonas euniceicola]